MTEMRAPSLSGCQPTNANIYMAAGWGRLKSKLRLGALPAIANRRLLQVASVSPFSKADRVAGTKL